MASKSKKIAYRVNITKFAPNYIDNKESHVVVKATGAREAAELHHKAMQKGGLIGEDVKPMSGFVRTWNDMHGDGCDMSIGRSPDVEGLTHRLYVRPESVYSGDAK